MPSFDHEMLREIYEQPEAIRRTLGLYFAQSGFPAGRTASGGCGPCRGFAASTERAVAGARRFGGLRWRGSATPAKRTCPFTPMSQKSLARLALSGP